jgi:hypothetical protein
MDKLDSMYQGTAGVILLNATAQHIPTADELSHILNLVGQLVIIVGTIWKMFKKQPQTPPQQLVINDSQKEAK